MTDDGQQNGKYLKLSKKKNKRSIFFQSYNRQRKDEDYSTFSNSNENVSFEDIQLNDKHENDDIDNNTSWKNSRRVVELDILAENSFCHLCKYPLHLSNIVSEKICGLGSVLHIRCDQCLSVCPVETGKRDESGAFCVNKKAVIGMIHCGFGPSHLRNFLMECNLPPMSETTIQKIQKKIGQTIIDCAVQSCKEARQEEIDLSPEKVQVSFDAGWQKRGSGFNYNSNTGHASLIGKKTGKVLAVNIRSKVCKICDTFTVQHPNETVPYHDCSRNWSGSSTAMEVDMALNLLGEMEKEGCHVDIFHADNDSSTSGMLKSEFPNTVKMDDQNHVKKGFTKQLYELGKRYKELKQAEVIPYIQRCFVYAIQSNAGNSTKIHEDLDRIVPHIFGDHNKCRTAQWCTYNENPSSFRYKSLPGGRPLQSEDLKKELEDLVSKYKNRAENLSQLGSTQANESFNNLVATKAPKSRNYGGSKSLEQRLSAALLQKNEGYSYLTKVNEAAALSPGRHTLKVCDRIDKLRRERRDKVSTIKAKRRRLQLKRVRNKKEKVSTIKEGTTYSTNIALSQQVVEEQIPSPLTYNKEENYVVIDLETTGLGHNSDITQIAAVGSDGSKFSCYVTPRCNISKEASRVTGLTFSKLRNKLFLHGLEVPSKLPNVALLDFIEYLTSMNNPILVGHNITNFDIPVLTNRLIEFHLFSTFCKTVYGFIDTLKVSRRVFPKSEVQNHKQETLVEKILQFKYDAHNAVEDVHFLQLLFDGKLKVLCHDADLYSMAYHYCKLSFQPVLERKVISSAICVKICRQGISLQHLKLANRRDPNGIRIILKENKISLKAIKALHVYINESEE